MENYKEKYEDALERARVWKEKSGMPVNKQGILDDIFPELKESEDERIRKSLTILLQHFCKGYRVPGLEFPVSYKDMLAWLEKQGEQTSDKIVEKARTEKQRVLLTETDGSANIDWDCRSLDDVEKLLNCGLNFIHNIKENKQIIPGTRFGGCPIYVPTRYDKFKKQGEQKPADKVESKFKVGDWITIDNPCQIISIDGNYIVQYCDDEKTHEISKKFCEFQFHLWTIQDAKDGDVLAFNDGHGNDCIELIKSITDKKIEFWFCLANGNRYEVFDGITPYTNFASREDATPATKEQRDLLFSKMKEAGYEWDAEKKELKKMKQKITKLPNGEDYGIDSLYHAARILEKTLGNVDGYQSDDGILEHKCAIEAVNRLYKQKPAWSEEDETKIKSIIALLKSPALCTMDGNKGIIDEIIKYLKSLKDRVLPQSKQEWNEEDESLRLRTKKNEKSQTVYKRGGRTSQKTYKSK